MNAILDLQSCTDAKKQNTTAGVVLMNMGITPGQAGTNSDVRDEFPEVKILTLGGLLINDSFSAAEEFASYSYEYKNNDKVATEKEFVPVAKEESKHDLQPLKQSINNAPLPGAALTRREIEIVKMAAKEFNSGEIAARLDINVRTVETHRKRIMAKTNCKNFIGVVIFALKNKYIHIEDFS